MTGLRWIINSAIEAALEIYRSEEAMPTLSDRFRGNWLKVNQTADVNA